MGASQSSGKGGGAPTPEVKTSYYDLLGVPRQATEDELKKAYRRKALELHPDRNYGDEAAATKVFAEVRAAYEVLSDPQERAWYDSHESAILRGEDDGDGDGEGNGVPPTYENVRVTTADDLARMLRRFNRNVEFSDAPEGFFGFLRKTFAQVAKEEEIAARWEGVDAVPEYPGFGHKDDGYDDVVKRFYAAWSSFATVKSFAWKDQYRLSEAPDRWYRRRMEQENKKLRQDGVREFNDAVRSLVAFVRKRDPRYIPSTQTEEERQKTLRDAAAAQAARARAANEAKLDADVPEWTRTREAGDDELEGNFDEEEMEEQVFECVACNKIFKSEKQWEAHERSKKHQKAVYALQEKMRKENANLDLDSDAGGGTDGVATPDEFEGADEELEVLDDVADGKLENEAPDGLSASTEGSQEGSDYARVEDDDDDEAYEDDIDRTALDKDEQERTVEDVDEAARSAQPSDSDSEDDDYAPPEAIQARMQSASLTDEIGTPATTLSDADDSRDATTQPAKAKIGKAAQKRAKKAAATAAAAEEQAEANHKCAGCEAAFPTKSRLFQHLKDHPKHTALRSVDGGGKGKKGKGKR